MRGGLDAAILIRPTFELPKTVSWQTVRKEPLILLTPADMRVRDRLKTFVGEPFIRYDLTGT